MGEENVVARAAVDLVEAEATLEEVDVVAAGDDVVAGVAVDAVRAGVAVERVVSISSGDRVAPRPAVDRVVAYARDDRVVAVAAVDRVVARRALLEPGIFDSELGHVAHLVLAVEVVVAGAAVDRVNAAEAEQEVALAATDEVIVAHTADEFVDAVGGGLHAAGAVAVERVGGLSAGELIVAGAATAPDLHVYVGADRDDVVTDAGVEADPVEGRGVELLRRVVGGDDDPVRYDRAGVVALGRDRKLLRSVLVARHEHAGPRSHVEHERSNVGRAVDRSAGLVIHLREHRLRRRAGVRLPVEERDVEEVEAVFEERHEPEGRVEAELEESPEKHVERALEVEHALRAVAEVAQELVEVDSAVAIAVLEVGPECAPEAAVHTGLRDGNVELRPRADGGRERQFGRVVAAGHVIVEVGAVEDLCGVELAAAEGLPHAAGVEAHAEVGGEADAAKHLGEQRREDREALLEAEARAERRQVERDQGGVAAEEHAEELV